MMNQSIHERYYSILKDYFSKPEEEYLSAAAELGRELVLENIPPEEVAELHEETLHRLGDEYPDKTLLETANLVSLPLMEILMAYGLVFREQLAHSAAEQEQTARRERETAVLAEASRLFNTSLETEEIFNKLANLISEEIADTCSIFTTNNDNHLSLITAFRKGKKDAKRFEVLQKNPPTLEGSVTGSCVENKEPVLIRDTYQDERFNYYYRDTFGVKSYICVPLISKNEILGVISTSIDSERPRFEADDLRFVISIADRAAQALETAKLYEEALSRAKRLSVVNEISKAVTSSLTFDKVYDTIVEQLKGIIPFEFSMNIAIYNLEDDTFAFSHAYDPLGTWSDFLIVGRHYKPHQLTLSIAFDTKQTLYVPDTRTMDFEHWSYLNQKGILTILNMPMIVEEKCIGTLNISAPSIDAFSQEEIKLLETTTSHLAIAINNAEFYEKLRKTNREMAFMNSVMELLNKPVDTLQVLKEALDKALGFMGLSIGFIYLVDEKREKIHNFAHFGVSEDYMEKVKVANVDDTLNGHVIKTGKSQYGNDFADDPRVHAQASIDMGWRSFAIVPIRSRDKIWGTISVVSVYEEDVSEDEVRLLEALGAQVGVALENSTLYEKEKLQAQRLSVVSDISKAVTSSLDTESVYETILQRLKRILPFNFIMNFALYRSEDNSFIFSSTSDPTGVLNQLITINHSYPADSLMLTKAFKEKTTLIQDMTKEEPPQFQIRKAHAEKGLKLLINVPLMVGQKCMGTFNIGTFDVNVISKDEIELLETVSSHLAIAINNSRIYEELQNESKERKNAQEEIQLSLDRLRKTLDGTIQVLASTVEARDPYTAGHQRRVADLACAIASEMNISQEQIDGIHMAGIIHDLGKMTIPVEILSKPGKLSEIEFNLIKTHPQVGYDMIKDVEIPERVIKVVLQHHEKMDGSGYPHGLAGENIIIEARIMAVADVVEAMASHRPYRPALGIDKALEEITRNSGIHYDPRVVEACLSCITSKGYILTLAPGMGKPAI